MHESDFAAQLGTAIPYLRRYARALTGDQSSGDRFAAATLEAILLDRTAVEHASTVQVGLFRAFHLVWTSAGAPTGDMETGLRGRAQRHLSQLTENTREALLLHTIEEFTQEQVAEIMGMEPEDVAALLDVALQEMEDAVAGRVLVIEDEPIIAMDLEEILSEMGHQVIGVASTHSQAVSHARANPPELILSDIRLADESSGLEAVQEILDEMGDRPVIFITAYPEQLLTGEQPEPAFLISKPYKDGQVRSAISQAMFFASTETLKA